MRILFFLFLFSLFVFGQQVNFTFGKQTPSGSDWSGSGIVYVDTTTGTTNDIIVDLNDFYPFDINPLAVADSGSGTSTPLVSNNSTRFYVGTFYCLFDNQGAASPTTDSVLYTIKVYPGVYTSSNKPISGIKWGTAVTLETIRVKNDYMSVNNVYLHATAAKAFPPEVIKLEIAPIGVSSADDSTAAYWRFAYPAIHQQQKERKPD